MDLSAGAEVRRGSGAQRNNFTAYPERWALVQNSEGWRSAECARGGGVGEWGEHFDVPGLTTDAGRKARGS